MGSILSCALYLVDKEIEIDTDDEPKKLPILQNNFIIGIYYLFLTSFIIISE
jgi:hypothetical protein